MFSLSSKVLCYLRHEFDDKIAPPTHKMTRNGAFSRFYFSTPRPDVEKFQAEIYNIMYTITKFWTSRNLQ